MDRDELIRMAFYGCVPVLDGYIRDAMPAYELDGNTYPPNGFTLAEYIAAAGMVPSDQWEEVQCLCN